MITLLKLLIWDLDDTLWRGTLAEGDEVSLFPERIQAIRTLNQQGVANSICSKNDFEAAKRKLEELGIFDEFVFPEINFAAKGQSVKRIISDMNLRAPDVVFIDDNQHNLEEVKSVVPEIDVYDARGAELDEFLARAIEDTKGGKSRVEKYRLMEKKRAAREELEGSNVDFLKASNIRMAVLRTQENFQFATRLEELVNRTNQLNFLKTRIEPNTLAPFIIDVGKNQVYSVFVWDKFGHYGLVGFAFVRTTSKQLKHFTFSCRIMNMGIEEEFAWFLNSAANGPHVPAENLPVTPRHNEWITILDSNDDEAREAITRAIGGETQAIEGPQIRIMANCQSGSIAHYLDVEQQVAVDNWPRAFRIQEWSDDGDMRGGWHPYMVYGAFVDYQYAGWATPEGIDRYRRAVEKLENECRQHGAQLIVLLPSDYSENIKGESTDFTQLNDVWRSVADESNTVDVIELDDHIEGKVVDPRHFSRETLISTAKVLSSKLEEYKNK